MDPKTGECSYSGCKEIKKQWSGLVLGDHSELSGGIIRRGLCPNHKWGSGEKECVAGQGTGKPRSSGLDLA